VTNLSYQMVNIMTYFAFKILILKLATQLSLQNLDNQDLDRKIKKQDM